MSWIGQVSPHPTDDVGVTDLLRGRELGNGLAETYPVFRHDGDRGGINLVAGRGAVRADLDCSV